MNKVINIRGTSGSGKSSFMHRLLKEFPNTPVEGILSDWKKPRIIGYEIQGQSNTYIIGSYRTQCGGCDSFSYKGSFEDMERMIREAMPHGNVIFEGLTVSSTLGRFLRISQENPGTFAWLFMDTPEQECHRRILARNGGREPKRDKNGLADYQKKYRGCVKQAKQLEELGEHVEWISSDDSGYKRIIEILGYD